jgi:hypothetical protein
VNCSRDYNSHGFRAVWCVGDNSGFRTPTFVVKVTISFLTGSYPNDTRADSCVNTQIRADGTNSGQTPAASNYERQISFNQRAQEPYAANGMHKLFGQQVVMNSTTCLEKCRSLKEIQSTPIFFFFESTIRCTYECGTIQVRRSAIFRQYVFSRTIGDRTSLWFANTTRIFEGHD